MTNKQITEQEYQDLLLKNAKEYQRACEFIQKCKEVNKQERIKNETN